MIIMMNLAILIAGLFFLLTAGTSLYMYSKGYGKKYIILCVIILFLLYLVLDISKIPLPVSVGIK